MGNRTALILLTCLGCVRTAEDRTEAPTQVETQAAVFIGDILPPVASQGAPRKGGTLRVALAAEPPSLNPQLDPIDGWGKRIHGLLNESLAHPKIDGSDYEARLARRWERSADGLTLTFFLRDDIRWHDGQPFDADDVIYTFNILQDPKTKSVATRSFLQPVAKSEKLSSHTVRFSLSNPYWLAFDAIAGIKIYPEHIYAGHDINAHPANRSPVGTGPYKFERWKPGEEISLVRNHDYNLGAAHFDRIVFKYVVDSTVRLQMLRRGDLDVVLRVTPDRWLAFSKQQGVAEKFWRLRHIPNGIQWLGWNTERPMFSDKRVRQAMTMLIDRDDIIRNLRHSLDDSAQSWFYPGSPQFNSEIRPWPYNPQAAQELLDEAGWTDSNKDGIRDRNGVPFEFTFLFPAGYPFYEQLAGLLQMELNRVGISVKTERLEWAVYTARLGKHDFDACSLLWSIEPRNDPYQIWHSSEIDGGSNFIGFRHSEADKLLESARSTTNAKVRNAMYKRFSEILHDQQPYTLLFTRYNLSVVSKRIGGIVSTPNGLLRLQTLYERQP